MTVFTAFPAMLVNPADKSLKEIGPDLGAGNGRYHMWICGVLANNGSIYCIPYYSDKILKIDTVNETVTLLDTKLPETGDTRWSPGALAHDGCIYFMPYNACRILKFNPEDESAASVGEDLGDLHEKYEETVLGTNEASLVGDDIACEDSRWASGAVASDGVIYCMPQGGRQVLAIDPFREFAKTLEASMQAYPEELGRLFVKNSHGKIFYECGVTKFGIAKVFQAIEECVPLDAGRGDCDLEPFMVAAACENSTSSVIHFLLRRNPDALHFFAGNAFNSELENKDDRKRKRC